MGLILEVETDKTYLSPSGIKFIVLHKAMHGQACNLPMVVYQNIEPTHDKPVGCVWTMEESLFLKLFREA
jgi:hypothetical protein